MIDPAPTTGTPAAQHRESPGSTGRNTAQGSERGLGLHAGASRPVAARPQPNLSRQKCEAEVPDHGRREVTADGSQEGHEEGQVAHVVMFSGGVGSWMTAKRAAAEHGTANLTLLFADTQMEDEDTYRFLDLRDRRIVNGGEVVTPITLRAFRERLEAQPGLFDADEWGACACTEPSMEEAA